MRDPVQTIGKLIDHQSIAFLTSVDADGFPNTKAMLAPRKREEIKVFLLTTNTSSQKVAQFRFYPKAGLYFCDRRFYRGVMLKGTVEVLEDSFHKELIWQDGDQEYYPLGVTDPDYCVLKFTAITGRYYSQFKSEDFSID